MHPHCRKFGVDRAAYMEGEYTKTGEEKMALAFLSDIKEITGYLLIRRFSFSRVTFPSLHTIRGETLFRVHVDDPEYALLVAYSNIDHLEFPALREISNGSVGMYFEKRMCYIESINWQDIMMEEGAQFHYFSSRDPETGVYMKGAQNEEGGDCGKCDASCNNGCWGNGTNQCQKFSRIHCSSECGCGRCFGGGAQECCHSSCVGGCTGPTRGDCFGCKISYADGQCQDACPSEKFSFANTCVNTCPSRTVLDEETKMCLFKCKSNKLDRNGKCETVNLPGVLCRTPWHIGFVHSGNIDYYRNCTILDGAIVIQPETFSGGVFRKNLTYAKEESPMASNRLAALANLTEVTGSLLIVKVNTPVLEERTYFEKVETVGRRHELWNTYTLSIFSTSLHSAPFRKLREVYGHVLIINNENLCYMHSVNWRSIVNKTGEITIFNNRPRYECTRDNKICSSECSKDGCWGSQPEDCVCLDEGQCGLSSGLHWKIILLTLGATPVAVAIAVYCFRSQKAESDKAQTHEDIKPVEGMEYFPPNLSKFRTVDEAKLRRDKVLGKGAFGTVHRGIWMPEDGVKIPVAIKVLHGAVDASDISSFMEEAFLMAAIQHPNLLRMLAICMGASETMLVSQLMPLGGLLQYLRHNKNNIGSKSMLSWCAQIAKGMEHLERNRVVHRDLAARNVVMETPNSVKITDFGLAKLLNFGTEQYQGRSEMLPLRWLAPECFNSLSFSHKSDVWAFGVAVWEILTCGETPFEDVPSADVMSLLNRGERLEQPDNCTIDLYMLLIKTWMLDPECRPSFSDLMTTFSQMCLDPGHYLVIENDELRRLPRYTPEEELIRRLASTLDRFEDYVTAEKYISFDYARAASHYRQFSSISTDPLANYLPQTQTPTISESIVLPTAYVEIPTN